MKIFSHDNIITFYDGWEAFDSYNYVLEYIDGEDLYENVTDNGPLHEETARRIIIIILDTLNAIHNSGVIHRDIKPENIMIQWKNSRLSNLKLIDFGFAIYKENITSITPRAGTINYMAPEILAHQDFSYESDIFSLGVIMYFILSGQLPFYSEEEELVVRKILEGDYNLDNILFYSISNDAKDLIK